MAEEKIIYCGPCEYDKITEKATDWCTDCEEGYCSDCVNSHKATKISRTHHLLSISDYHNVERFSVNKTCTTHRKQLDFFCPAHDVILCLICVQSDHSRCSNMMALKEAAQGSKTSTALSDLEHTIDTIIENIENGLKMNSEHLTSLTDQEQNIKEAIQNKRDQINKHLDQLQEKVLQELTSKREKCELELTSNKKRLLTEQRDVGQMKDKIQQMKQFASDLQVFVGIRMMNKSVNDEKEIIRPLVTETPKFDIHFIASAKVNSLVEEMDTFGEIQVATETDNLLPYVEPNKAQVQCERLPFSDINNIRLRLRKTISLGTRPQDVSSCLILPNSQLMFVDQSKTSLTIYNEDGSYSRDIDLLNHPYDAALIDHHNVAVTFGNHIQNNSSKDIAIVNTYTNKIEKKLSGCFKAYGWGISHHGKRLYALAYEEGIKILDLDGKVIKTLSVDISCAFKITVCRKAIFYSDAGMKIYCLSTTGENLWTSEFNSAVGDVDSPAITTDREGNIYATGGSSNTLVVISRDGKNQKVLLDTSDGLDEPNAVHYDKERKCLLICNRCNGRAALYDVQQ